MVLARITSDAVSQNTNTVRQYLAGQCSEQLLLYLTSLFTSESNIFASTYFNLPRFNYPLYVPPPKKQSRDLKLPHLTFPYVDTQSGYPAPSIHSRFLDLNA